MQLVSQQSFCNRLQSYMHSVSKHNGNIHNSPDPQYFYPGALRESYPTRELRDHLIVPMSQP